MSKRVGSGSGAARRIYSDRRNKRDDEQRPRATAAALHAMRSRLPRDAAGTTGQLGVRRRQRLIDLEARAPTPCKPRLRDPSPDSDATVGESRGVVGWERGPFGLRSSASPRACRETSSPSNARLPVSISYSTTPKAQMSARLSTVLPARLLGTHVGRGAEDHPRLRHRGRRDGRRHR